MELLSGNNDGGSIDMKNYRCHGLRRSKNNGIWVLLQNGFLDDNRPKGRLTFLTQKTLSTLSKSIFDVSNSENMTNDIQKMKDNLELFRLLACSEHKDAKNSDSSYSFVLLDLIKKEIEGCGQGVAIRTEKMQLYLWMCHLFGTLSNSEEVTTKWDSLADTLHRDILCLHALKILKMYGASDPDFNSDVYDDTSIASLKTFYMNFRSSDKKEVARMKKISPYRWNCSLCLKPRQSENETSFTDCFRCREHKHTWPRCVLTLKVCDQPNLLKCRWCESVALKMPMLDYTNVYCSICSG